MKRKANPPTTSPSSQTLAAAKPVARAVMTTRASVASMPLRRWRAGPGVSVTLTHTAPVDIIRPHSKWPS
ncbi:hypothetical protein [Hymenobacter glacialis]|uniref:hypothetical protein n=1 Tax=Hymenobacter glacialis TaxID=1908236 RepID=UPI0013015391|nr:hypothetical protein [Hymenobacter glacialis]